MSGSMWLLFKHERYENSNLLGVFAEEDHAKKVLKRLFKSEQMKYEKELEEVTELGLLDSDLKPFPPEWTNETRFELDSGSLDYRIEKTKVRGKMQRIEFLEAALRKLTTVNRSEWVSGEWVAKIAKEALKGGE